MSTAVLKGAGCGEWVVESEDSYVALACQQAGRVDQLRADRAQWRRVASSSLHSEMPKH